MTSPAPITVLLLLILATGSASAAPDARTVGATYWVGQRHFQYVGVDASKRGLWLYPHLDGVAEILTDQGDAWYGPLGSVYAPKLGAFTTRFSALENSIQSSEPEQSLSIHAKLFWKSLPPLE